MRGKYAQPPEVLKKLAQNARPRLDALQLLPHALYYALASLPMPWQPLKYVTVVYHADGSISFIKDTYKIGKKEFRERWRFIERHWRDYRDVRMRGEPDACADNAMHGNKLTMPRKHSMKTPMSHDKDVAVDQQQENTGNNDGYKVIRLYQSYIPEKPYLPDFGMTNEGICGRSKDTVPTYKARKHKALTLDLRGYLYGRPENKRRTVDIPLACEYRRNKSIATRNQDAKDRHSAATSVNTTATGTNENARPAKFLPSLLKTRFFQKTELEWTEAMLILLAQGRGLLGRVLYKKKLSFLELDEDLNLVYKRAVTTKERKRGRLGTAFHLARELLKLLKCVADAFVKYRTCSISVGELCCSLKQIFSSVGTLTGIYRYKYRMAKQINACTALQTGRAVWVPQWRVWCRVLRGHIPLLEAYTRGLLSRMKNGRDAHPLPPTSQRAESNFDIKIKDMIKTEAGNNVRILQHFNERWRCWKADVPYQPAEDAVLNELLEKYCRIKAEWYVDAAINGRAKGRQAARKRLGKITRLYIKNERARQADYMETPFLSVGEAVRIYRAVGSYTNSTNRAKSEECKRRQAPGTENAGRHAFIGFPESNEMEILECAIARLKKESKTEEAEFYDSIDKKEWVYRIKRDILAKRAFRDVQMGLKEERKYRRYYNVHYEERITDAFLDTHLWHEADKLGLFPRHVEVRCADEVSAIRSLCQKVRGGPAFLIKFECKDLIKNIDLNLLNKLLRIFVDPMIVNYIISRLNCRVVYKDMSFINSVGVIPGFQFSSFISAFWSMAVSIAYFSPEEILLWYHSDIFMAGDNWQALVEDVESRIPPAVGSIRCISHSAYPYSFDFTGFSVELRTEDGTIEIGECQEGAQDGASTAKSARPCGYIHLKTNDFAVAEFKRRVEAIARRSTGTTFLKPVNQWNALVLEYLGRYRDAANMNEIKACESKIQDIIKRGINSKMAARFPPVLFYAPRCLGGLGMLSVAGPRTRSGKRVPSIAALFGGWSSVLKSAAIADVMEHGSNKLGVLNRCQFFRSAFSAFTTSRLLFGTTRRVNLDGYDVLSCFGGSSAILKHTLCSAINITDPRGIQEMWDAPEYGRSTRAQKAGAAALPNKRFILWWSPTINRSGVRMGYEQSIEPTGVRMHGKLSSLKLLFVQIFRGRLWQQIHEEAVLAVSGAFGGFRVIKNKVSRKKSYKDTVECDLSVQGEMATAKGTINSLGIDLTIRWGDYDAMGLDKAAYERHSAFKSRGDAYERKRNGDAGWNGKEMNGAGNAGVGCKTDEKKECAVLAIVLDLCLLKYALYGPCSRTIGDKIKIVLDEFIAGNPLMQILRERLRVSLALCLRDSVVVEADMFNTGLICEVKRDEIYLLNTGNGNLYYRRVGLNAMARANERMKNTAACTEERTASGSPILLRDVSGTENKIGQGTSFNDCALQEIGKAVRSASRMRKKAVAAELLNLIAALGVAQVAVSREMSRLIEKSAEGRRVLSVRIFETPLQLCNIASASTTGLRGVQFVYFKDASNCASYCRLRLILRALGIDKNRCAELGIIYNGAWSAHSGEAWEGIEAQLRHLCGIGEADKRPLSGRFEPAHFDTERQWREDYMRQNELIKNGSFLCGSPGMRAENSLVEDKSSDMMGPGGIGGILNSKNEEIVEIPRNIIDQFRLISCTRIPVKAFIKKLEPFTVVLPPQYLSTTVGWPGCVGIVSNVRIDAPETLHVIINERVGVRRKHGAGYARAEYVITNGTGVFLSTAWNYNFRIELFDRKMLEGSAEAEETPLGFYESCTRPGHFQRFVDDIKKHGGY